MKIGTFVTKNRKPLTEVEIHNFDSIIRNSFANTNLIISEPRNMSEWPYNPLTPNVKYRYLGIKTEWEIKPESSIIGRNLYGDRLIFHSLAIEISKDIDENGVEQYELWAKCDGRAIRFNSRNCERIQPKGHFNYGTEAKDLEIEKIAKWLKEFLKLQRSTTTQLRRIYKSLVANS